MSNKSAIRESYGLGIEIRWSKMRRRVQTDPVIRTNKVTRQSLGAWATEEGENEKIN
jgi:hypothetical protein